MSKLYTERDIIEQGDYYSLHTCNGFLNVATCKGEANITGHFTFTGESH